MIEFLLMTFLIISSANAKYKEASYYQKLENKYVKCLLCFRNCKIPPGKRGFCTVRENIDGKLYSLIYNKLAAIHIDPIEKEPVYHVFPGSNILCIATVGCSMRCKFCHNWTLSQVLPDNVDNLIVPPEKVVKLAKQYKCIGISYTYSEPTVFFEYMRDISKLAKKENLKTIVHTCGAINLAPLEELMNYTDIFTVDLKGFNEKFYKTAIPNASLEHVLEVIKFIKKSGKWLELVNLIIPKYNDNLEDITEMCKWIKENLGDDVPLHFSRFFPAHKFKNLPPTPISTLEKARKIAIKIGLKYVTIGNVPGHFANSTFCPNCKKVVIRRHHFEVLENNIVEGRCKFCNQRIPGVWEK